MNEDFLVFELVKIADPDPRAAYIKEVGELVMLVTGGPPMRVFEVRGDKKESDVVCHYFNNEDMEELIIPSICLIPWGCKLREI